MVRPAPLALSAFLALCASQSPVLSFTPGVSTGAGASRNAALSAPRRRTTTPLHNVPPPSTDDPEAVKESADRQGPPASFYQLQLDSARSAQLAIDDGFKLLEVEFPPLPSNVLEMDDVSAYDVAKANLNLAIDFGKSFAQNNKRVTIMLPDEDEVGIALEDQGTDNPYPGVTISSLRRSEGEEKERMFKPDQLFLNLFGSGSSGSVKAVEGTNVYVCIVASAQELPDIEELSELDPDATIVFYNMKLDVLRGDLGAPAFPSKEFGDRFLSKIKPVYYLRTRQYSRSTAKPPFMVNYQGCLFRTYPGEYQTLLDTGNGRYRRVLGSRIRPGLGQFKEQLTDALREQGVIEEEGKTLSFLRTGYKTTTWWEDERENASDSWKT